MSECPDCDVMRKKSTEKDLFGCALCGVKRCADHTIWVPAHELDKYNEEVRRVKDLLKGKPQSGWYPFCGKGTHVPRGLSIRHGKEKVGGMMVQQVTNDCKKEGLEFFAFWEVGIIENSLEKWWDINHYALSCSLAPAMILVAHLLSQGGSPDSVRAQIYEKVITGLASKKDFFDIPSKDTFMRAAHQATSTKDFAGIICSFCGMIPCLNRQRAYHDDKKFKKMIKDPEF